MPPTVAVVGASANRAKYGNKSVRAHLRMGYTVYPVNPRETEIEGIPAFPDLRSIPHPVDRISMYVPPKMGLAMLDQIAEKMLSVVGDPNCQRSILFEPDPLMGLGIF